MEQESLNNEKIKNYSFLEEMFQDSYFPNNLVEKGRQILLELCKSIETQKPPSLQALYLLTHKATDEFNELAEEFDQQGSEIETAARDNIGMDFDFIATAYGFEADPEEIIATRDW